MNQFILTGPVVIGGVAAAVGATKATLNIDETSPKEGTRVWSPLLQASGEKLP